MRVYGIASILVGSSMLFVAYVAQSTMNHYPNDQLLVTLFTCLIGGVFLGTGMFELITGKSVIWQHMPAAVDWLVERGIPYLCFGFSFVLFLTSVIGENLSWMKDTMQYGSFLVALMGVYGLIDLRLRRLEEADLVPYPFKGHRSLGG